MVSFKVKCFRCWQKTMDYESFFLVVIYSSLEDAMKLKFAPSCKILAHESF